MSSRAGGDGPDRGGRRERRGTTGPASTCSTPASPCGAPRRCRSCSSGYSVSSVAKAAGVTRATFYSYWPGTDAYLDDLLEHLVGLAPVGFDPDIGDAVNRLTVVGSDVVTNFLAGAERQLRHLVDDPSLYVRYGFLARSTTRSSARGSGPSTTASTRTASRSSGGSPPAGGASPGRRSPGSSTRGSTPWSSRSPPSTTASTPTPCRWRCTATSPWRSPWCSPSRIGDDRPVSRDRRAAQRLPRGGAAHARAGRRPARRWCPRPCCATPRRSPGP